jgi:mevalonate pyrophosphate decarboxylase
MYLVWILYRRWSIQRWWYCIWDPRFFPSDAALFYSSAAAAAAAAAAAYKHPLPSPLLHYCFPFCTDVPFF